MADSERKSLVWDIRKSLSHVEIASNVGPVPGKDPSKLSSGDAEGSSEYINSFMYTESMLEAEDKGLGELLALKDIVDESLLAADNPPDVGEMNVETSTLVHAPTPSSDTSQSNTVQTSMATSNTSSNILQEEVHKMISDYEMVSKTISQTLRLLGVC